MTRVLRSASATMFVMALVILAGPAGWSYSVRAFYPAEAYHQDYLTRNPTMPYIAYNDLPKINDLKRISPELYRAAPVLVAATASAKPPR